MTQQHAVTVARAASRLVTQLQYLQERRDVAIAAIVAAEADAESQPPQAAAAAEETFFDAPRKTRNASAMGERPSQF